MRLRVLVLFSLAACGPARVLEPLGPLSDGGSAHAILPLDAGRLLDAGQPIDAGAFDGGEPHDAGLPHDAGEPVDAGGPDDAGQPLDAGQSDDAGAPTDAGQEQDAGAPDAGWLPPLDAGPPSTRQTAMQLGTTTAPNGFYEYLPPGYPDGSPRPLLVFWHGLGEDGNGTSDLYKVLNNGPPKKIANDSWSNDLPFIVLSPQNASGCPSSDEVSAFFSWARANYDVDPHGVYLTGLSCGAIGSWAYLGDHWADGGIAAALLSSGDPNDPTQSWSAWGKAGCNLGNVAIWAAHGTSDPVVNIANEANTMADLLACPSRRDAIWMPIDGGYHDVWTDLYDGVDGDVYGWLLAHPLP